MYIMLNSRSKTKTLQTRVELKGKRSGLVGHRLKIRVLRVQKEIVLLGHDYAWNSQFVCQLQLQIISMERQSLSMRFTNLPLWKNSER